MFKGTLYWVWSQSSHFYRKPLGNNGICSMSKVPGCIISEMWMACHSRKILLLAKLGHHPSLQSLPNVPWNLLSLLLIWSCRAAAEKDPEPWTSSKLMLPSFRLNHIKSQLVNSLLLRLDSKGLQLLTYVLTQGILKFWGKYSDICWTPCEQLLLSCLDLTTKQVRFFIFVFGLVLPWKIPWNTKGIVNQETGNLCSREFPYSRCSWNRLCEGNQTLICSR